MSSSLYDVCIPELCLITCTRLHLRYDFLSPVLCLETCMMTSYLYGVWLATCTILRYFYVCLPAGCTPMNIMCAQLHDVRLPERCVQQYHVCLSVLRVLNCMMSAYQCEVCADVWYPSICMIRYLPTRKVNFLPVWCLPTSMSPYLYDSLHIVCLPYGVLVLHDVCSSVCYVFSTAWYLPNCMSAYLYDVCSTSDVCLMMLVSSFLSIRGQLNLLVFVWLYDLCSTVQCLPTWVMSAQPYDLWLPVWSLFNSLPVYLYVCWTAWCLANCSLSFLLRDVCLTVCLLRPFYCMVAAKLYDVFLPPGGSTELRPRNLCRNFAWKSKIAFTGYLAEVGKVTRKSNANEALRWIFIKKSNGDEALNTE